MPRLYTMDFTPFRCLTFDCYGTMIDWESGILAALRPIVQAHGATATDADLLRHYAELESAAERGPYIPYREVLRRVVRGLGERLGFVASDAEANALPDSLPTWRPFADTVAALQRLQSRYRLAVISNVDDDLFAATAQQLHTK